MASPEVADRYLQLGALFVAVGVDTTLLARAAENLAARFGKSNEPPTSAGVY